MIGSANTTHRVLITAVIPSVISSACIRIRLALSRSSSPRRRATSAETATFKERKNAKPINFGWVVSPTAVMA